MANSAVSTFTFTVTPTGTGAVSTSIQGSFTNAPSGVFQTLGTQTITTSDGTLDIGAITGAGKLAIKNLDATNFVQVDAASTYDKFPQKILPGDFIVLCPQTTAIHLKADTASVTIQYLFCNS